MKQCVWFQHSSTVPKGEGREQLPVIRLPASENPEPVLIVSPSWLNPGASVTLRCEVKPPAAGWRFYWYKAVPDISQRNYRYELLPDSIKGTVEDFYIIHGQRNTAGYACRAGRGNPEYLTDYSEQKIVWSPDSQPAASLRVSPNREKHFTSDNVQLYCVGKSASWRVKRFTNSWSDSSDCSDWGTVSESSCTINSSWSHLSVYWCESGSGEFSNAVNITIHNRDLLLVSPVHPATEGASVILSCKLRGENTLSNVIFYHNEKLVQNDSRGELDMSAVSQSDEGFYKCEYSGKVSPQSWMAVEEQPVSKDQHQDQQQIYSSLLHGDLCVYETIRGSGNSGKGQHDDSETIPDCVGMTSP
ncbi:hypothetical protein CRENBAI_005712 [Crenichthys baileyi]|uniref:Ig-like domain-containing protein n=1 Tax=Crenichthys baileyi TaxID=28760 RepID=A0AAV9RA36_9TELE